MNQTLIFIIIILGVVVGVMALWVWLTKRKNRGLEKEIKLLKKEFDESERAGEGLAEYYNRMRERKENIKSQITKLLEEKEQIKRGEIIEKLGISATSAVRYFDELEKQGKIRQIGKAGRNAHYTLIE